MAKSQKEKVSKVKKSIKLKKPTLLKVPEKTPPKSEKSGKKSKNTLPPDTYKDEFDPVEIEVDESRKFIVSVKRGGDMGLPMCDLRQYQTTEIYSGFTKKGINFPIELLPDLIEALQEVYEKCDDKGLL